MSCTIDGLVSTNGSMSITEKETKVTKLYISTLPRLFSLDIAKKCFEPKSVLGAEKMLELPL